ncbi:MAG: peptidoglycan glycosyltransferase [Eubacterium sp.]|nr:peptidoglycan glycosyltransferase [Eubacterium sp.]
MIIFFVAITGRLIYLMVFRSAYYTERAAEVQERERKIKAPRGKILDRNGNVLASNETVCTVSVIYNQIENPEKVIEILSKEMDLPEEEVRKKVKKKSSREKIQSNVPKTVGDRIRTYELPGVKVDEDYKRYYPYGGLASKVLGFTGADNQGIIGLEVQYDQYLEGQEGIILTPTDSRGIEQEGALESRVEPVAGGNLITSMDLNIQKYAQQIADFAREAKQANYVSIIVMNPKNGEIYAMVNSPEFDLNHPYELQGQSGKGKKADLLNRMWRNQCINDTYEPGSTFKVITATAALEENVVTTKSRFFCPGYKVVDDRRIKCHKTTGHGSESFVEGTMNSCNPVFIQVGLELGPKKFYQYMGKLGLFRKTGIDLPGEASTIVHKIQKVGDVELATMSFGQSFQITPMQYLVAASAAINGGTLVTPHFALRAEKDNGELIQNFSFGKENKVISAKTSKTLRQILEKVVAEGTGSKGRVEGFRIGGKTATSQKLPRGSGKYIASYMGFAPANDPEIIAMAIVDEPKGIYYGGQVAAPLISRLYENILPYILEEKKQGE